MTKLENVSAERLRTVWEDVESAKAARRLAPAIVYKEIAGVTQTEAAALYGFSSGWASNWFDRLGRLAEEPFEDVVYDEPRSGRPSELSDEEYEQFVDDLRNPPDEVGIDVPAWTVPHAQQYLRDAFDVEYSRRHVRRLLSEAGLSWQTTRSRDQEAGERSQRTWHDEFDERRTVWTADTQL